MSVMSPEPLVTTDWWSEFGQRLWRQAYQTALVLLPAAFLHVSGVVDVQALVASLITAEAITLVKFTVLELASIQLGNDPRPWVRLLDRAVPAFCGVFAGLTVQSYSDLASVNWLLTVGVAFASAVAAVLDHAVNPPKVIKGELIDQQPGGEA